MRGGWGEEKGEKEMGEGEGGGGGGPIQPILENVL